MQIHFKGLIPDRFEDVPDGIGTLFIAPDCKLDCPGCCNQHMRDMPTIVQDSQEIIQEILSNEFNDWIIFAGLDPLTYPEELYEMINLSLLNKLKIIIYTGLPDRESLLARAPGLSKFTNSGVLIKYGWYDESKKVTNYYSHGVLLATSNQYIEYL